MAFTFAKKQILYAISRIMEMADVEEVDWIGVTGPRYSFEGINGYEVKTIYKPNLEDWTMDLSEIPPYNFVLLSRHYTTDDLGLTTFERLFYAVLERLVKLDILDIDLNKKQDLLARLTEEYSLETDEN